MSTRRILPEKNCPPGVEPSLAPPGYFYRVSPCEATAWAAPPRTPSGSAAGLIMAGAMTIGVTLVFLAAGVLPAPAVGGTGPSPVRASTLEERVLVERVHWPVYVEPRGSAAPGTCSNLSTSQVEVEEDGESVDVTAIDRRPLPLVHAIVLDTSSSMTNRLERVKDTAIRYVERLPAADAALVASFDETLVLRSPPTLDRERLRKAIRGVTLGDRTALWSALHDIAAYLDPMPALKVLVLLSDGEDTASRSDETLERVGEEISKMRDLAVFPIGINLPRSGRPEEPLARYALGTLASETGGRFYDVTDATPLDDVFDAIRERIARRVFVTYIPAPHSGRPEDAKGQGSEEWKRVEVRARKGVPCRVVPAGPRRRRERSRDDVTVSVRSVPIADRRGAPSVSTSALPTGSRRIRRIAFPQFRAWRGAPGHDGLLDLLDPPGGIVGRVLDMAPRPRVSPESAAPGLVPRAPRGTAGGEGGLVEREFFLAVPRLEELKRERASPEDLLAATLSSPGVGVSSRGGSADEMRPFVDGRTFLSIRGAMGAALFEYFPEYRAWASDRLLADGKPEIEALLEEARREGGADAEKLHSIRSALEARATAPAADQPQRFLAEWLGDVPVEDAAIAFERKAANRLLGSSVAPAAAGPPDTAEAERVWARLVVWLSGSGSAEVLVPMDLAYDADRDVVGFYRFLLGGARSHDSSAAPLPYAPLGLRTIRWLLAQPGLDSVLRRQVEIRSIDHAISTRRERHEVLAAMTENDGDLRGAVRRSGRRAVVTFTVLPPVVGSFSLVGYFVEDGQAAVEPVAIGLCGVSKGAAGVQPVLEAIVAAARRPIVPCPEDLAASGEDAAARNP